MDSLCMAEAESILPVSPMTVGTQICFGKHLWIINISVTKLMSVTWDVIVTRLLTLSKCLEITPEMAAIFIVMLILVTIFGVPNMTLGKETNILWQLHFTPVMAETDIGIRVIKEVAKPML